MAHLVKNYVYTKANDIILVKKEKEGMYEIFKIPIVDSHSICYVSMQ